MTIVREEFVRHGMEDIVTLTHRNVCKEGFTVENLVDSGSLVSPFRSPSFFCPADTLASSASFFHLVFLDLPAPWDAIGHAKKALRVRPSSRSPHKDRTFSCEMSHAVGRC